MANISLDKDTFLRRLKKLYDYWQNASTSTNDLGFAKMDCLVSAYVDDDIVYSKSAALQTWLFGYELTDTIMVLAWDVAYFLASKKEIEFLRPAESVEAENSIVPIKLLVRDRNDKDEANFKALISAIKGSKRGKTLGVFSRDKYPGKFMDSWRAAIKKESFATHDVSLAVAYLMSPKEDSEIITIKEACMVSVDVFTKYLKEKIMDIIESDKKVKHRKLSDSVECAISDEKYVSGVDLTQTDMCYPAIIQSGGNYNLRFSVVSDKNILHFGSIVCSFGVRYKSYCSNIVRTLLVNPSDEMQNNYKFLVSLEEELLKNLTAGTKLSEVYDTCYNYVKNEKPALVDNLTKSFGFAMGIEIRESSLIIGPKTTAIARKGMVFSISIGLANLKNNEATDKESEVYALFIGDTVLVNDGQPATILTNSKKKIENIGFFLEDEEDDDEDEKVRTSKRRKILGRRKRTAVLDSNLRSKCYFRSFV